MFPLALLAMAINLIDRPETLPGQLYKGGKLSIVGSLFIMNYHFSLHLP